MNLFVWALVSLRSSPGGELVAGIEPLGSRPVYWTRPNGRLPHTLKGASLDIYSEIHLVSCFVESRHHSTSEPG